MNTYNDDAVIRMKIRRSRTVAKEQEVSTPSPESRRSMHNELSAKEFDTSDIESKNGIHSRGNKSAQIVELSNAGAEERNGIQSRGTEGTNRKKPIERKEPQGREKVRATEKKNGVHSKNSKDNLKKKEKKSGGKKKGGALSAAKQEMRSFVIKELTDGDENENAAESLGKIFSNMAKSGAEKNARRIASAIGKGMKWIVMALVHLIIYFVTWLISTFFSLLVSFITAFWPVLLIAALIVVLVAKVAGFAGIEGGNVITKIKEHASAIVSETEDADVVEYHVTGWYSGTRENVYLNQDDMLLIYLSMMSDFSDDSKMKAFGGYDYEEDLLDSQQRQEIEFEQQKINSELFYIDTHEEENTLNEVLGNMLYCETSTFTKYIQVTATPVPTAPPTVSVAPTPASNGTGSTSPVPSPTPAPKSESSASTDSSTGSSATISPAPTPTPQIITIPVEAKRVDIYMYTGDEAVSEGKLRMNPSQRDMYYAILDVFTWMGYSEGNGSTVCDSY